MKKLTALIIILALLIGTACAETGDMITETGEDGTVYVHGIESDPQAIAYGDFAKRLTKNIMDMYDGLSGFDLTPAIYSAGCFVHVGYLNDWALIIRTTDDTDAAQVLSVELTDTAENSEEIRYVTQCVFNALTDLSQIGQSMLYLMTMDENVSFQTGDYWLENGWQLTLSTLPDLEVNCIRASIVFRGLTTACTAKDIGMVDMSAAGRMPFEEFKANLTLYLRMMGLPVPEFGEMTLLNDEYPVYIASINDNKGTLTVLMDKNSEDARVNTVTVMEMDGDSNYAWAYSLTSFLAFSDPEPSFIYPLTLLAGGHGNWDALCEMTPYALYNDVVLQTMKIGSSEEETTLCATITQFE